jgi:hypothetical protein
VLRAISAGVSLSTLAALSAAVACSGKSARDFGPEQAGSAPVVGGSETASAGRVSSGTGGTGAFESSAGGSLSVAGKPESGGAAGADGGQSATPGSNGGQSATPGSNGGQSSTAGAGGSTDVSCSPACDGGRICSAGKCQCPSEQTDCTGTCVDLQTDKDHCGACSTSCSGGNCSVGRCYFEPLSGLRSDQIHLAVNSTYIYYVLRDAGTVGRVNRTNGTTNQLASMQSRPMAIAVDGSNVYWVNQGLGNTGSVMQLSLAGGDPTPLATNEQYPQGIAVDADHVYWTNFAYAGSIKSVPIGGGTVATLASDPSMINTEDLAIDANNVYWVNAGDAGDTVNRGTVMRVPLAGGSLLTIASKVDSPTDLAVSQGQVYFLLNGLTASGVQRVSVMGSSNPTPITSSVATSVAADATGVFVAGSTSVVVASLDGTSTKTLSKGGFALPDIALDNTNVYWSTGTGIRFTSKTP